MYKEYKGALGDALKELVLPKGVVDQAHCSGMSSDLESLCEEILIYKGFLTEIAGVWDSNSNRKQCSKGRSNNQVVSAEYAYCDNECAFIKGSTCYLCKVNYKSTFGDGEEKFVCASEATGRDAVRAFCAYTSSCGNVLCEAKDGSTLADGTTSSTAGNTIDLNSITIGDDLGAQISVSAETPAPGIKFGASATVRVSGSLSGSIQVIKNQPNGAVFSKSGFGNSGLRVRCAVDISGMTGISLALSAKVSGEVPILKVAKVEVGADNTTSLKFSNWYQKSSPEFSGAGQTASAIRTQCIAFAKSWVVNGDLPRWLSDRGSSGLEVIEVVNKAADKLQDGLYLKEPQLDFPDTYSVFCKYPAYDKVNYYRTAGLWLYNEPKGPTLQWGFYKYFGIDLLARDKYSNRVPIDPKLLSGFPTELANKQMTSARMLEFFNTVVAPSSKADGRADWAISDCILK